MKTVRTSMNSSTTMEQHQPQSGTGKTSIEQTIFKLKLQWIMAKDENEKKRLSEQIRQLMNPQSNKNS